jgi:chemotaxis protein CheD
MNATVTGKDIFVSIAEVKTGSGQDVLKASLGSCVGIAILWPQKKIYGLAHCLLPETLIIPTEIGARYVNHAIPSLLTLMNIRPENYPEIYAVITGGGNMTAPKDADPAQMVGTLNSNMAERCLTEKGIRIQLKDLGGNAGRRICVFCETGDVTIDKIPRIQIGGSS